MKTTDMKTSINSWGNSLGVRIPKAFAEQAGLKSGESVEMLLQGDTIYIKKQKYCLEDMLKAITPDSLHEEIDFGGPVGRELL